MADGEGQILFKTYATYRSPSEEGKIDFLRVLIN